MNQNPHTPFLERLLPQTRQRIESSAVSRVWAQHASIFRAGEPCMGLHIIVRGLVKLYRSQSDGREQTIMLEGPGGVLAVAAVIDDEPHLVSAQALRETATMFLGRDTFLELYQSQEDFRDAVIQEVLRRFRAVVALLDTIALKSVSARVAARVLDVAVANGALDGSRTFRLLLSQQELAHVLGTTRESIARALADLHARQIIEKRGARLRVIDANALFASAQVSTSENTTPLPSQMQDGSGRG